MLVQLVFFGSEVRGKWFGPTEDLEHVLSKAFLLSLGAAEPLEDQLAEVGEVDQTLPAIVGSLSYSFRIDLPHTSTNTYLLICSILRICRTHLAMLFGISTTSCSVGLSPSIFIAPCRSCSGMGVSWHSDSAGLLRWGRWWRPAAQSRTSGTLQQCRFKFFTAYSKGRFQKLSVYFL